MNKNIKIIETEGCGKCPDCVWFNGPGGCNVKRDSEICRLNRVDKDLPTVVWQGGNPNEDRSNWLCPTCLSRPAGSRVFTNDEKLHCIYCGTLLVFQKGKIT